MEVSGDDDILKIAVNRGRLGIYHVLARRTTAGIYCNARDCLQRTALTTSFIRQVAKVDIRVACAEPLGDSETSLGRWTMDGR